MIDVDENATAKIMRSADFKRPVSGYTGIKHVFFSIDHAFIGQGNIVLCNCFDLKFCSAFDTAKQKAGAYPRTKIAKTFMRIFVGVVYPGFILVDLVMSRSIYAPVERTEIIRFVAKLYPGSGIVKKIASRQPKRFSGFVRILAPLIASPLKTL